MPDHDTLDEVIARAKARNEARREAEWNRERDRIRRWINVLMIAWALLILAVAWSDYGRG